MEKKLENNNGLNTKAIIALSIYFIAFIGYSYFFRIDKNIDIAFLFKPFIIPAIAFAYFFLTKNTFYFINLYLFLIIYFADNLTLLEDRSLYAFSTYLYLIIVAILFHYAVVDSKIFYKKPLLQKIYPYLLFLIVLSVIVVKIYNYMHNEPFKEIYLIIVYVFLFSCLLILTICNALKNKSVASRFLLATILSLFLSDIFIAINGYYFNKQFIIYLACVLEIPVYYFLLRYFLHREETVIQ